MTGVCLCLQREFVGTMGGGLKDIETDTESEEEEEDDTPVTASKQ